MRTSPSDVVVSKWGVSCAPLDAPQALTEVATVVARSLYAQAGGDQARLSSINADPQMVRCVCPDLIDKFSVSTRLSFVDTWIVRAL